ncbi:MAG: hypothetical protein MZW92_54455 [Comamonadaceae bacterium]|nr:hypothetical protein [Comamonadaceae bacterium]
MASFWRKLLEEVSTKKDTIWNQEDQRYIWKMLRWEFIILIDRLALLSGVTVDERYRVFACMKEHYRLPYASYSECIRTENFEFYPLAYGEDESSNDGAIHTDSGGDLAMLACSAVASMPPLSDGGMHEQEDGDSTDEEAQKKPARDVDSADEDDRKMPALDTTGKYVEKNEEDNQKMAATENSKKRQGLTSEPPREGQNKKARPNKPNRNNSEPEQIPTKPHDVAKSTAGGLCCALELCRSIETKKVYLSGNEEGQDANGTNCIGCKSLFHYCLLVRARRKPVLYELLQEHTCQRHLGDRNHSKLCLMGFLCHTQCNLKTRKDLEAYVNKELQKLEMGKYRSKEAWKREYNKKRQQILREIQNAKTPKIRRDKEDLLKRHDRTELFQRRQYFETVEHLIRHWKESTDGVVVGLRYDGGQNER